MLFKEQCNVKNLHYGIKKYINKKRASPFYRTAQPLALAAFPPWGSSRELVVKDLPTTKVEKKAEDYNSFFPIFIDASLSEHLFLFSEKSDSFLT